MTREEAIKILMSANVWNNEEWMAWETLIPELRESEDERIRKWLITQLETNYKGNYWASKAIDYLEKQKEQKEELVYHLNGLMQDYIKEGKDDDEKEHRLKCYQLFWDALEDTNFFEQKEQKPAEFTHHETNESLCDAVTHQMEDDGDIDDFVRRGIDDIALKYAELGAKWQKEQKPAEWSDTKELVFKDICNHLEVEGYSGWVLLLNALRNGEFQPKKEWSKEDEKMLQSIIKDFRAGKVSTIGQEQWLKSLRSFWKPSEEQQSGTSTLKAEG